VIVAACAACGGTATRDRDVRVAGVLFGPAPRVVARECAHTAAALGYAIPCPTVLPVGITPTPGVHGCQLRFIAPAERARCGGAEWRGWAVGSVQEARNSSLGFQHLALEIAPRVVTSPTTIVDWPLKLPDQRVKDEGHVVVGGVDMALYFVPPATNEGSVQMHHLVVIWTQRHHTYCYGFHVVSTLRRARAMDLAVVRQLTTVAPPGG
jgi:hypothetical protein